MKKKLLLTITLSLVTLMSFSQVVWDDFDNPGSIDYTFVNGGLNQAFTNPLTTGINSSALCARYGRSTETYDVIVIDPSGSLVIDNVGDYVTGAKKMSMKVFSPDSGLTVQITLENRIAAQPTNYPTGRHSEYTAETKKSNEWETLEFSFVNRPDNSVSDTSVTRMVILFVPNSNVDRVFLFDDLMGPAFSNTCSSVAADSTIAEDFECQRNVSYSFINGNLVKEANPDTTGMNPSESVGKFTKWATGVTDGAFGGALTYPFKTSKYKSASIMLYNTTAGQNFLVIFQDASNNNILETTFTTTSTTSWEKFDINLIPINDTITIAKYVLLLNPSTQTEDVIYYDNFKLSPITLSPAVKKDAVVKTVKVYPNPIKDKLIINSDEKISGVKLYDVAGKLLVETDNITISNTLDVSTLENGIYFVSVTLANGNVITQKIIK